MPPLLGGGSNQQQQQKSPAVIASAAAAAVDRGRSMTPTNGGNSDGGGSDGARHQQQQQLPGSGCGGSAPRSSYKERQMRAREGRRAVHARISKVRTRAEAMDWTFTPHTQCQPCV
jgi:hypothetical protein